MAAARFTVPNWGQELIARAVNLDPDGLSVQYENEDLICFLEHKTRKTYQVNKTTGGVIVS